MTPPISYDGIHVEIDCTSRFPENASLLPIPKCVGGVMTPPYGKDL